jgi:hypothetical protein
MSATTLPDWLWIAAFTGCFLFGGMCAAVLLFTLFGREERDTIPCPAPVHRRASPPDVPALWPRDDEHTHTQISRT